MKAWSIPVLILVALGLPQTSKAATPAISAGGSHSVALHADGTVRAWGGDSSGELGIGRVADSPQPVAIPGPPPLAAVAAGDYHSLALRSDGGVWAWDAFAMKAKRDGKQTVVACVRACVRACRRSTTPHLISDIPQRVCR